MQGNENNPGAIVYLGLGANLGDREGNLAAALRQIGEFARLLQISRIYETEPVGLLEQPQFLNMACSVSTCLDPEALRLRLKQIEAGLGRDLYNPERNAPRPIDVDILLYDDLVMESETLRIPHKELVRRAFVLAPICDLAADLRHPVLGRTISEIFAGVDAAGIRVLPETELQYFSGCGQGLQLKMPGTGGYAERAGR